VAAVVVGGGLSHQGYLIVVPVGRRGGRCCLRRGRLRVTSGSPIGRYAAVADDEPRLAWCRVAR